MVFEFLTKDLIGFLATFAFTFALLFALLIYAKIFPDSRKAMGIIAAAIGLVTASYEPAVLLMTSIIPVAAIFLVFLFFIMLLKKLFFTKKEGEKNDVWPAMVGLGTMLVLINVSWDKISGYIGLATVPGDTILWMIGILVILIILLLAYSRFSE